MSFKCKGCKETVSYSKMAGLVLGQVGSATLESKGIKTQRELAKAFDTGEFGAGVLSGFRINCPSCNGTNWEKI